MRIRFLTSLAMNHGGGNVVTYAFGEQVDLPDEDAKGLVRVGHAELVDAPASPAEGQVDPPQDEAATIETAVSSHPDEEHAVKTARKKRS